MKTREDLRVLRPRKRGRFPTVWRMWHPVGTDPSQRGRRAGGIACPRVGVPRLETHRILSLSDYVVFSEFRARCTVLRNQEDCPCTRCCIGPADERSLSCLGRGGLCASAFARRPAKWALCAIRLVVAEPITPGYATFRPSTRITRSITNSSTIVTSNRSIQRFV
jgi:hypothetical protein